MKPAAGPNQDRGCFEPPPSTRRTPCTVLIVDDDEDARLLLGIGLRKRGLQVVEAGSVSDAKAARKRHSIDVIVTDWQLPDGDAVDVREAIDKEHRVAALVLTGFDTNRIRERVGLGGFSAQLLKPVKLRTLVDLIEQSLRNDREGSE